MYVIRVHYYVGHNSTVALLWSIGADEGFSGSIWDGAEFVPTPECASVAEAHTEVTRLIAQAAAEIERRRTLAANTPPERDAEI